MTASPPPRILVIDDDPNLSQDLARVVNDLGYVTEIACDGEDALEKLGRSRFDAIVTDLVMPRMDGFAMMRVLLERGDRTPAIVLTGFGTIREAMMTIHDLRAFWFLQKPVQRAVLGPLLERAVQHRRLTLETERLRSRLSQAGVLGDLVGRSAPMQEVFSLIQQAGPTSASVLITGESGTGKELVANALHHLSRNSAGPFVAVNCAALPSELLESELFGHEKGSFTGAVTQHAGCFEQADHGTLFLDEIGEMALPMQAKLLRVLEDSRVRRLGGKDEIKVQVRIVAATNRPVEEALEKNLLREDLYFRLNVFNIALPPLRHRKGDIPLIAESFIGVLNAKNGCRITDIDSEALGLLMNYSWPGNVRELRNVLERASILAREGTLLASHLPLGFGAKWALPVTASPASAADPDLPRFEIGRPLHEIEEKYIRLVLKHNGENRTRAAQMLGISVRTLYKRLSEMSQEQSGLAARAASNQGSD